MLIPAATAAAAEAAAVLLPWLRLSTQMPTTIQSYTYISPIKL
jgi:hypothetical protein